MSKSLGNHVGLTDSPDEMFGKLMSIPDNLIIKYYELLTDMTINELKKMDKAIKNNTVNPRNVKAQLAKTIICDYYDTNKAEQAEERFIQMFRKKDIPDDVPVHKLTKGKYTLLNIMSSTKLSSSKKEAQRLIQQQAVSINGKKISEPFYQLPMGQELIIKVGKRRFLKIQWV